MKKRKFRGYWTSERLKEEALKYSTTNDFKKNNKDAYHAAHKKKIFKEICSHMSDRHRSPLKEEELQVMVLTYKNRISLKNSDESLYRACLRSPNREKLFSHMEPSKKVAYTFEELKEIASKYQTRGEFKKNNPTAYRATCRRPDRDKVWSHMPLLGGTSYEEKELLNYIQQHYPQAKKKVDRKVKILNKPYIKGFDIDVFVFNKGIEFDGNYTHSLEGLRRNRHKWTEEDLKNYHDIKDAWFKTQGIEILHIKQFDWKQNKEECLKKCLEFLG